MPIDFGGIFIPAGVKRWLIFVFIAVAVVALVISCVAMVITIINKSDEEEMKGFDGYEKRFEAMEQELKTKGKDYTPEMSPCFNHTSDS